MPRPAAEHLISVGALAEFGLGRRELLWQLGLLVPRQWPPSARSTTRERAESPAAPLELPTEQDMVRLPDMDDWERMVADYGLLGLSPRYHPLALLRAGLPADVLTAAQLRASSRRRPGAHGRPGRLPPAARHRQGLRLSAAGGRDRA